MKKKVLVTAIGTMASTEIVAQLKIEGSFYVLGADIYNQNQIATSKDVDDFFVFPSSVDNLDGYIEFALEFCAEHGIEYYFATIDEEIANLSRNRGRFEKIGVKLCIPNQALIEICHYKNVFSDWIKNNIPEIWIKSFSDIRNIKTEDFPVFIKPVEGRAGGGCRKIEKEKQLRELLDSEFDVSGYVVQKFTEGDVVTVDMARNAATGQEIQVQRMETVRNANGCGTAVEIINDLKLSDICHDLMSKLTLNGIVNAEFFRNGDDYKIIEINPRFSAGCGFTCRAGVNTVLAAVDIADGKRCVFGNIVYGKHYTKRYDTYDMDA